MEFTAEFAGLYQWLKVTIGAWPGGQYIKIVLKAMFLGGVYFLIIAQIERFYGVSTLFYKTRNFLHDAVYWLFYRFGLSKLWMGPFLYLIGDSLEGIKFELLAGPPFLVQVVLYLMIADFLGYWIHRMQHAVPFLWAFHTTHHSQRDLNFASTARFHPVEHFLQNVFVMVPVMMLGFDPKTSLIYFYLIEFNASLQHSQIPWRYGPLYYVISSPTFHSFHHSRDPAHRDKNFAGFFTFYDFLFGTAVDEPGRPKKYGLDEVQPTSLLSTLTEPFVILRRQYRQRQARRLAESG